MALFSILLGLAYLVALARWAYWERRKYQAELERARLGRGQL